MRANLSSILEILGIGSILAAAFAADWRVGVALIGLVLVVLGYLSDEEETE